eukprot:2267693-Lingulodinium_polyedra.AAC.1
MTVELRAAAHSRHTGPETGDLQTTWPVSHLSFSPVLSSNNPGVLPCGPTLPPLPPPPEQTA